jgi:hypothetical protein
MKELRRLARNYPRWGINLSSFLSFFFLAAYIFDSNSI